MPPENKKLKFSIIIPSYNEKDDIRLSIESTVSQNYPNKEIIVVDDSSDNTPDVIREYKRDGVKYIRGFKRGCCGARNQGVKIANGDVIILLNADVRLPPDFLERVKKHYDKGADYVLVRAHVLNQDYLFPRYIDKLDRYESDKHGDAITWSEGFSCRREAALEVGLFPGDFPVRFCRDWVLGANLDKAGYKKVIDDSIKVYPKAPQTLKEFFYFREIRGRFAVLIQYYFLEYSLWYLVPKFVAKEILTLFEILTIIRPFYKARSVSMYSPTPIRDFLGFFLAYILNLIARTFGEWRGFIVVFRYGKGESVKKAEEGEYKRRW